MFGMGMWEILLIVLLILVVMGPEKIPEAAKMLGKGVREVRKMSNLLRDAVDIDFDEPRKPGRTIKKATYDYDDIDESDYHHSDDEGHDPPPSEIFAVPMSRRAETDVVEFALRTARDAETHREVYLHVPFEETI